MNLVPIKDYEGLYSIDLNNNQVYGHKHKKYLKPQTHKHGYYYVELCKNSKPKKFLATNKLKNDPNRAIADFISGMTDRYAINLHKSI